MSDDVQRFLERFADFGGAPDPGQIREPLRSGRGARVLHPGMTAPLHRNQVRAYMTTYLAGVSEFVSTSPRGPSATARCSSKPATAADRAGETFSEWGTVYCVTLRGDRVLRDAPTVTGFLLARLMPEVTFAPGGGTRRSGAGTGREREEP